MKLKPIALFPEKHKVNFFRWRVAPSNKCGCEVSIILEIEF